MKKRTKFLGIAIISSLILTSCGEKTEDKKEDKKKDEPTEETVKEEITYETFDSAKLEGNWKVIDAQAYSKDQMMGQTYSFIGDEATYFAGFGERGMIKGGMKISGDTLSLIFSEKNDMGTTTMTSEYTGGFFEGGKKLQLNALDALITLEKQ